MSKKVPIFPNLTTNEKNTEKDKICKTQLIEKTQTEDDEKKGNNNWKVKILLQFLSLNGDKTTRKQEKKPKRLMHHFGRKKRNLRITLKSFFYSHFSRLAFVFESTKEKSGKYVAAQFNELFLSLLHLDKTRLGIVSESVQV